MKLLYWKSPANNFGDYLNLWLWKQLIPGVLDEDESIAFVGIGTLLNDMLHDCMPKARRFAIFSSGVGYGRDFGENPLMIPKVKVDDSWKIYCLRGPLSAQALGVSCELAVTDGALLLRRLFKASNPKVNKLAFMPHLEQAQRGSKAWKSVCEQIGFGYIDPRWSIEQVLSSISQTEILLTEAMHGAIVGDALRVPWIPLRTNVRVLGFKWWDWCLSIGLQYQPRNVVNVTDLAEAGIDSLARHWAKKKLAAIQLAYIAKTQRPFLSDDTHIENLTVELEKRLQQFKDDVAKGHYCE